MASFQNTNHALLYQPWPVWYHYLLGLSHEGTKGQEMLQQGSQGCWTSLSLQSPGESAGWMKTYFFKICNEIGGLRYSSCSSLVSLAMFWHVWDLKCFCSAGCGRDWLRFSLGRDRGTGKFDFQVDPIWSGGRWKTFRMPLISLMVSTAMKRVKFHDGVPLHASLTPPCLALFLFFNGLFFNSWQLGTQGWNDRWFLHVLIHHSSDSKVRTNLGFIDKEVFSQHLRVHLRTKPCKQRRQRCGACRCMVRATTPLCRWISPAVCDIDIDIHLFWDWYVPVYAYAYVYVYGLRKRDLWQ